MIKPFLRGVGIWVLVSVTPLWSVEWHVNLQKPRVAKFISRAPLEEFEGVTSEIDGYLYWEGDSLFLNNEFYFEVNLNSIKTGIGLRDRHMRERYLETDKWPVASYAGKIIAFQPYDSAGVSGYTVQTEGEFTVHGVSQRIQVSGIIIPTSGDELQVTAAFAIELPDYNIDIPKVMIFKLDKHIKIRVQFFLRKVEE